MWAHSLQLSGFVYNDSHGVYVEIQGGATADLQSFVDAIDQHKPRLCRITNFVITKLPLIYESMEFEVRQSPLGDPAQPLSVPILHLARTVSGNCIVILDAYSILLLTVLIAGRDILLSSLYRMIGKGLR